MALHVVPWQTCSKKISCLFKRGMWQLACVFKRNVVLLSGAEAFTLTLGLDFLSYGHESHDASCSNNLFLEVHAYQRDHAKPNLSCGSTYQSPHEGLIFFNVPTQRAP